MSRTFQDGVRPPEPNLSFYGPIMAILSLAFIVLTLCPSVGHAQSLSGLAALKPVTPVIDCAAVTGLDLQGVTDGNVTIQSATLDTTTAAAALSLSLSNAAQARWEKDPDAARREALAMAQLAVQSDARDPQSRFALGNALLHGQALGEAVQQLREAVHLNPSHAAAHANLAFCYNYQNRPDQALDEVMLALRLSPHDPRRFMWLPALAGAHYLAGNYREALRAGQEALAANSSYLPITRYIIASMGQLGTFDAAKTAMPLLIKLDQTLSNTEAHLGAYFHPDAVSHIAAGLRKAGFT